MPKPAEELEPRLDYPTRMVRTGGGLEIEEYLIPVADKAAVLKRLYPFKPPVPALDEVLYDIHAEKKFTVRDFRVTREGGMNMLVSPFYFESGGSVIDWAPPDWDD
jgi:hypothetical protein